VTAPAAGLVRQRLDDGLDVIVRRVPGVAVAATCLQYDVGFRNEPVSGLAHLTEHLLAGP
jgi:predicted Zn-dependent peptidase